MRRRDMLRSPKQRLAINPNTVSKVGKRAKFYWSFAHYSPVMFYQRSTIPWTMFPLAALHISTSAVLLLSLATASSAQALPSGAATLQHAETEGKQINHEANLMSATNSTASDNFTLKDARNESSTPITMFNYNVSDQFWAQSDVRTNESGVLVNTSSLENVFNFNSKTNDTIIPEQFSEEVLSVNANVETNFTVTYENESFKKIAFNSLPSNNTLKKHPSERKTAEQKTVLNITVLESLVDTTTQENVLNITQKDIERNISTKDNVQEISEQENLQNITVDESVFDSTEQERVYNSSSFTNLSSHLFPNSFKNISDSRVFMHNTTNSSKNDSNGETENESSKIQSVANHIKEEPLSSHSTKQLCSKDSEKVNETSKAEQNLSTVSPPNFKEPPIDLTEEDSSWDEDQQYSDISEEAHGSEVQESGNRGCRSCRMRAIDKDYRILQFKNQILNGLHMTHPPNTSGLPVPNVPPMMHLYEMDRDLNSDNPGDSSDEDDDFVSKTERVFVAAKEAPWAHQMNLSSSMYFTPAVQHYNSYIESAFVWFYIRPHPKPPQIVTVERVIPDPGSAKKFTTQTLFAFKLASGKASGWKRVDVTILFRQWIQHSLTNLGLVIKADDAFGNNLIVLTGAGDVDKGYEPWLDTKIMESRHISRKRRSEPLMCVENSTDTRCCRHPLIVSFAEFEWNWIIAPTHVHADYCTGECRMTMMDEYPSTWVTYQQGTGRSCCTPTKRGPLTLLYFDENRNVVYQILQNMKVERCGCA